MKSLNIAFSGKIFSKYHRKLLHFKRFLRLTRSVKSPAESFFVPVDKSKYLLKSHCC